jgi:hypothetical protein
MRSAASSSAATSNGGSTPLRPAARVVDRHRIHGWRRFGRALAETRLSPAAQTCPSHVFFSYRRLSCGPKWGRASDSHHYRSAPLGWCCERDRVPVIARPFQQKSMGLAADRQQKMLVCRGARQDKSKLHWAADTNRAPEPVQRTAPDPPKRTAPVGIGPAVPASEIDLAARLASANSESSAMSIPAGTDAVGTESHAPPQREAASPSAALVGALIFVLLTLWALAARAVSLQQMPPPATITRAGPPRRGAPSRPKHAADRRGRTRRSCEEDRYT